jgi:hypothetical protein
VKPLRWLAAGLVWIVAGVVGLLGGVLCITVILIPLGIPLIMLSRRLYGVSARLVLPRSVRHPLKEMDKAATRDATSARKRGRKWLKQAQSHMPGSRRTFAEKVRKGRWLPH